MSRFVYIAKHVGKNKFLKTILRPFWNAFYVKPREKKLRAAIYKNGILFLKEFDSVLSNNKIPYSLAFGTLLGAIREHGFIKHDMDIDVALWSDTDAKKVCRLLEENGFKRLHEIVVDDGDFAREESYEKYGIKIDLFYFYPSDRRGLYSTCVFVPFKDCLTWKDSLSKYGGALPLQLFLPMEREVEYLPFESIKLPVTKSALDFVETRYGKNWRIPDPTFVYPKPGYSDYMYREDKLGIESEF